MDSDVAALAREFPGWRLGTVWQSASSGPDAKSLTASRDGVFLADSSVAGLAAKIRYEEGRRQP